jgi:hypothetical protein
LETPFEKFANAGAPPTKRAHLLSAGSGCAPLDVRTLNNG